LVEAPAAQAAADAGPSRVVAQLELPAVHTHLEEPRALVVGVDAHRAELVAAEELAVAADAYLGVEDRARALEADRDRDQEVERARKDEQQRRDRDVDRALEHGVGAAQCDLLDPDQRYAVDVVQADPV